MGFNLVFVGRCSEIKALYLAVTPGFSLIFYHFLFKLRTNKEYTILVESEPLLEFT